MSCTTGTARSAGGGGVEVSSPQPAAIEATATVGTNTKRAIRMIRSTGSLQSQGLTPEAKASAVPSRSCAESFESTSDDSDIRVLTGGRRPASVVQMSTKKPVILIADDDPEILTMLGIRLSKKGYQVLEAVDGNQTLSLAHKHHPDLVLLDVMMPGRNGWEVAKELRSADEFANVGIVMLTAIGEKVNEMTSPLYGADAYVDKPFDFSELEAKIKDVLSARQKH